MSYYMSTRHVVRFLKFEFREAAKDLRELAKELLVIGVLLTWPFILMLAGIKDDWKQMKNDWERTK